MISDFENSDTVIIFFALIAVFVSNKLYHIKNFFEKYCGVAFILTS